MDAYDSDPDESQPTQMLQELLERGVTKAGKSRSSVLHTPNEVSSDSLPSSRASNSIPQYNLHGLASTQTQSQQDEEVDEGSQKENIGSSKLGKDIGRSNVSPAPGPGSPQPSSSSTNAQAKAKQAERSANFNSGNDKVTKPSTKAAFQSPHAKTGLNPNPTKSVTRFSPYKPPVQAPSRYKPPLRPISPSSQDSFACDADDTEERFLAKSEKFAVPLSELGQGSSPVRGPQNTTGGTSTSSMYAYPTPSRKQHVPSSPPTGRVLVEATPSESSQSQDEAHNVSNQWVETQPSEDPEPENQQRPSAMQVDKSGDANGSDCDSEPSSSYKRLLRGEHDPSPPVEMVATQVDDSDILEAETGPTSWGNKASTGAGPSTGPRSLISMVAPGNRYRYRSYVQSGPSNTRVANREPQIPVPPTAWQETQPSTQPSFPVQRVNSPADTPAPRFPANKVTQQSSRDSSPPPMDVDVIPDSEPLRDERAVAGKARAPAPAEPVATPGINKAPTNHRKKEDLEMTPVPEEMEEDEEDVPLAAATTRRPRGRPRKPSSKGQSKPKERAAAAPTKTAQDKMPAAPVVPTPGRTGRPAAEKGQKASTSRLPSKPAGGSWETGVVPSSVPEQDVPSSRSDPPAPGNNSGAARDAKQRSTSAVPKSGLRQGANVEESDNDSHVGNKGEDHEPNDEEDYEDIADPGPSRKRKRTATSKPAAAKKTTKVAQKRIKQETTTPAAGTRQAKKLRSATSNATWALNAPATRVLALWKQDGHFYPGTVHSIDGLGRYTIRFDDATTGDVTLEQIRHCRLCVGDDVLFGSRNRASKVISVDDADNPTFVTVDGDEGEEEVEIGGIRIASKTITYAWTDRVLQPEDVVPTLKPAKVNPSPSPSKISVASLPFVQGNRKKFLDKTGLVVTLNPVNGNHEKEKEKVNTAIKNCGGTFVEDFSSIIRMEGKHVGNSWILEKDDVQWIGKADIERLFLVADDSNQKPKFLFALALGIPCLGTTWLFESSQCGQEKDWCGYMLPQGYSSVLCARPSQQVDVDWGNSVHQLKHIMENSIPRKLFAGMSILCVGPDMVRQPKNKRRAGADDKMEGSNVIPQIILAMGADRVEAVTEARHATRGLSQYNRIVIRDENQYLAEYSECVTVDWNWVKESLIASRELPLPAWNEHSHEA